MQIRVKLPNETQAHREFLDKVAANLGITRPSDWNKISNEDVIKQGGQKILSEYGNSLRKALENSFPGSLSFSKLFKVEITWKNQLHVPRNHWRRKENQRLVFDKIAKHLNIREQRDWRRVSLKDIHNLGASSILAYHNGSLLRTLQKLYPGITALVS